MNMKWNKYKIEVQTSELRRKDQRREDDFMDILFQILLRFDIVIGYSLEEFINWKVTDSELCIWSTWWCWLESHGGFHFS